MPGRHEFQKRWIFESQSFSRHCLVAANPLFLGGIQRRISFVFGMSQLPVDFFKSAE